MKLEEVLPAMRAGRVARHYGVLVRFRHGTMEADLGEPRGVWTAFEGEVRYLMDDVWELEPEPKVEWPKGSLGWAITEAGTLDCEVRIRGIPLAQFSGKVTVDDAISLDWEVVP